MLKLTEKFKTDIINRYGENGQKWLNNFPSLIHKYTEKFELKNLQLAKLSNINFVAFANSQHWGDIVIKLNPSSSTSEIKLMLQYPENYAPKCYYSNIEDNIMILEKISPGYSLDNLENLEERIKVFCDLSNHLLLPANSLENFLSFENLFQERIEFVNQNYPLFEDILWIIDIAKNLYQEIKEMNLPKYILHDDLHHKNILKSEHSWKAIDPHGIIGERVIETCQFIRSELENSTLTEENIDKIVSTVSYYFQEDKKLILKTLYVFIVIEKIIWFIKNKKNSQKISYNINVCKILLNMLENKI